MPSTPNFGWPTPEDTAQVANGPAIIRALGDAADATVFAQGTAVTALDGRVSAVEGDVTDLQAGFRFAGTVYFTSSGPFVKADPLGTGDIGLRAIRVTVVGGGGGGGGVGSTAGGNASAANGGNGGGAAVAFVTDIAGLASSVTVTIGGGGAGAVAGASTGDGGGESSFGSLCVATGGGGGRTGVIATFARQNARNAEPLGVGTAGDLLLTGSAGFTGFIVGLGARAQLGGNGAAAALLGGNSVSGGNPFADAVENGSAAVSVGSGGSGAAANNTATTGNGGAGANGIVIIDCFV